MMLSISGLSYRYGKTPILRDIDLTIARGDVVCLLGPNGAGKSTLLKCINRILRPNAGRITLDGNPLENYRRPEIARTISYVPQQTGSSMSLKVVDMVALGRAPYRGMTTKANDYDVTWDAIKQLDLVSLSFRPFGELSGGQRQRVLIARALAQQGRLILLDEPTSNLDPYYQLETMSAIRAIAEDRNMAAIVALHDLSLAARLSDAVVLLHHGKVHANGNWRDVLTSSNLEATYGVSAIVGIDQGQPYVISFRRARP